MSESGENTNLRGNPATIKAVGDWELDVLAIPYGGPEEGGKDRQGEYFSDQTELYLDQFPTPLVVYYHGFDDDKRPMGEPEIIGKAKGHEKRPDGVWVRVVLDKANEYAKRVWEAAKDNLAKASSGSIAHLVRTAVDGLITHWPFAEITLLETGQGKHPANNYAVALPAVKSTYEKAGLDWPDTTPEAEEPEAEVIGEEHRTKAAQEVDGGNTNETIEREEITMDEKDLIKLLDERDAEKAEAEAERQRLEDERKVETEAAIKAALEADEQRRKEAAEKEAAAKANRLKSDKNAPHVTKFADIAKYDRLSAADMDLLIGILDGKHNDVPIKRTSDTALKALAVKIVDEKSEAAEAGRQAMKAMGMKANQLDYTTLTSYGDEWVGIAYATSLWESIRQGTFVLGKLPQIEFPPGNERLYLPLESTDPTFYHVPEVTSHDTAAGIGWPDATVTSSRLGTGRVYMDLNKMGARVGFSGEMNEDSLVPFVAQLRQQLAVAGAEQLEHAIIDGDVATTATTNINDIAGTAAATDLFLMFDGFRVSPLTTTTANSRDGGVLAVADFLETVKLMGSAGVNAMDVSKVSFILDPNTHWKALELSEVKTKDSYSQPTLEKGKLSSIWGYDVYVSPFMHYKSAVRKANSAGCVDQDTTSNNTKGAILAVRWDQWKFGWRRRMTMETTRQPNADYTEIVALARCGLIQRDTEAAAISYNITV